MFLQTSDPFRNIVSLELTFIIATGMTSNKAECQHQNASPGRHENFSQFSERQKMQKRKNQHVYTREYDRHTRELATGLIRLPYLKFTGKPSVHVPYIKHVQFSEERTTCPDERCHFPLRIHFIMHDTLLSLAMHVSGPQENHRHIVRTQFASCRERTSTSLRHTGCI